MSWVLDALERVRGGERKSGPEHAMIIELGDLESKEMGRQCKARLSKGGWRLD